MTNEEIIQNYYSAWEKKKWSGVERLLADGFTFTSPNDDDHIDKRAFKAKCWPEADWIERFELESVIGRDNEAFVKYLCRNKNGRSFRNVEHFRFAGGKVEAIEVYFGGHQGYPSQNASISQPASTQGSVGL
jgi:ketosteroid isomerase-like protein